MTKWPWRALALAAVVAVGAAVYVLWGLPPRDQVAALTAHNPVRTALMRQREQEARAAHRRASLQQTWVPLSRVSRHLIHAVIASEDQKFFGHEGVDWEAVKESVEANTRKGRFARGGSTITQQLAKNLYFGTRKTLTRKARELVVARWLEQDLTKRRILELYLNLIEWGPGVYGCEAAARRYYGKSCAALDEQEAAGLAAMIPNPRRINPQLNAARHARAQRRVLWLMARAGYLARDAAGLGAEPPPVEPVEEDEEEMEASSERPGPTPSATDASPETLAEPPPPAPADSMPPGPAPSPEPEPVPLATASPS